MLVSQRSLTFTKPRSSKATPVGARDAEFGFRPTVTNTLSTMMFCIFDSSFSFLSMKLSCVRPSFAFSTPFANTPRCVLIFCFLIEISSGRRNSLSKIGRTLSIASTTVTSEPSIRNVIPSSSPMYPPPTIATCFGNSSSDKASREEMTFSS